MSLKAYVERLRSGAPPEFPQDANSLQFAQTLDSQDSLRHLRDEFILPTKGSLKKRALDGTIPDQANGGTNGVNGAGASRGADAGSTDGDEQGIYFVGNSLGAQPKAVREYVHAQLETSRLPKLRTFGRRKTSMRDLRSKALVLTAYAEHLLDQINAEAETPFFTIITPRDPARRGTQLSILLREGLLDGIARALEDNGVMCDKRKPDVLRVAPVPLYSRFEDVWRFMQILRGALGL
ncbi:PLP-dependent transferase [Trichoderma longibrachiatum ATCC 18648]|uniref:PLP-dependent transferase n=1 Tax=Trichoderma longibrachiatum ATCC 18648 TaxID=983965 RepID=A0A2T4BVQ7_TRILO|nr:PLP-dependent transferase [Trichoderma longibrachiatum ATCC 18648]